MGLVTRDDWSLDRRGHRDQARHQEKVRKAIEGNLGEIVADEGLILSDGKTSVRVPVRSLEEYKFRYDYRKQSHVGQGGAGGKTGRGTVVAREPGEPGEGTGTAGDQPGDDNFYEASVSLAEIEAVLFADFELPNLEEKDNQKLRVDDIVFHDVRKKGLRSNLDKKRTLIEAMRRGKLHPEEPFIKEDDLRYKTWEVVSRPHSGAVVLAMMDVSGSMGNFEKYCARTFFFWMERFLLTHYEHVEVRFFAHHTKATEVDRESFFTRQESGGTLCSSAYALTEQVIANEYPPSEWNVYPVHVSDGDNLASDMDLCEQYVGKLNAFAALNTYVEVNAHNRRSVMMERYQKIAHPRFGRHVIHDKQGIYTVLKEVFGRRPE